MRANNILETIGNTPHVHINLCPARVEVWMSSSALRSGTVPKFGSPADALRPVPHGHERRSDQRAHAALCVRRGRRSRGGLP